MLRYCQEEMSAIFALPAPSGGIVDASPSYISVVVHSETLHGSKKRMSF